jgi:hypothetical protein
MICICTVSKFTNWRYETALRMYRKCMEETSGLGSPRQRQENISYKLISANTYTKFHQFNDQNFFSFVSVGTLTSPTVFSYN